MSLSERHLEIRSDDDTPSRDVDDNETDNSTMNFHPTSRRIFLVTSSLFVFLVVLYSSLPHHGKRGGIPAARSFSTPGKVGILGTTKGGTSSNVDVDAPVPPIHGMTPLYPPEFLSIRTARPNESVLVTGGLGFIGSHVVDLLLHRGFKVTILDDESNGHNHNTFATEMVPNDITVVGDLPRLPDPNDTPDDDQPPSFTHVVHLAAAISVAESMHDPDKYERINHGGSQKVLQWINDYNRRVASFAKRGNADEDPAPTPIRRVVAASSAAVYGDPDPRLLPLRESAPYGGLSPYADTKYRMEALMREFVRGQNEAHRRMEGSEAVPPASAVALRFFNVYGPRQDPKNPYSGVISLFLEAALNERDITILGDGEMTRDFVYVKDVARAIVMALLQEEEDEGDEEEKKEAEMQGDSKERKNLGNAMSGTAESHSETSHRQRSRRQRSQNATFSVYNVCTGKSITINTLATLVKERMNSSSRITHLAPREGDIRESSCDPNGAKEGMGFQSAVSQEGGLEKTADWFKLEKDSRRMLRTDGKVDWVTIQ